MPKKPPVPTTIGINPLDLVVSAQAVIAITGKGKVRKPGDHPDTTVLTVTVPSDLADDLEQIIAITPGTNLDTLATEALRAVLAKLERTAQPTAKTSGKTAGKSKNKAKSKAKSARDGGPLLVIVGE